MSKGSAQVGLGAHAETTAMAVARRLGSGAAAAGEAETGRAGARVLLRGRPPRRRHAPTGSRPGSWKIKA